MNSTVAEGVRVETALSACGMAKKSFGTFVIGRTGRS
jgi:hypothetical protein